MTINSIGLTQANTAGFIPEDWLTTALEVVRANIVLAKYCTKSQDMGGGGFSQGDTLNIPYPGTFTAQDKTAGNPITVAQPSGAKTVSLTLAKHKTVDFLVEDFAAAQADTDLMMQWMKPAAIAIVEALETDLMGLYSSYTGATIGSIGTPVTASEIRTARQKFSDAKIPVTDRFIVLSDADEIAILGDSTLQTYFAYHQVEAVSEATIGRLYGFDIYQSTLTPTLAQSGHNMQVLTMGGSPTGGSFTLTFSGQTTAAINWNATAAQVEAALAALSNVGLGLVRCSGGPINTATVTVALFTTTPAAITATNTGLTGGTSPGVTIADASGITPNFNLAIHKDTVLLAVRPFKDIPDNLGVQITQMRDPVSGLTLRMGYQYDGNYRGVHGWLDILYGFTAMRPEFSAVVLS